MSLILRKNGLFSKEWVYDEDKEEGEYIETLVTDPLGHLFDEVETFEEGFTFRDLCRILGYGPNKNIELKIDLLSATINENLMPFLLEMDQEPPAKHLTDGDPLLWAEVYNSPTLSKYHDEPNHVLESYWGIHAQGTKEDEAGCMYSLSYSHWGTFADIPLRLKTDTEFQIVTWKTTKDFDFTTMPIEVLPKFGAMLDDIFADLCFCGSPERRDRQMQTISDRAQEVKDGTATLVEVDLDNWLTKGDSND